ncbi:hypothetical protein BC829DRAFT_388807 [Chytridium lagenaria]|nr:hypothetical protein BC829DRAFT_388807 [Chytridium lagenaria]
MPRGSPPLPSFRSHHVSAPSVGPNRLPHPHPYHGNPSPPASNSPAASTTMPSSSTPAPLTSATITPLQHHHIDLVPESEAGIEEPDEGGRGGGNDEDPEGEEEEDEDVDLDPTSSSSSSATSSTHALHLHHLSFGNRSQDLLHPPHPVHTHMERVAMGHRRSRTMSSVEDIRREQIYHQQAEASQAPPTPLPHLPSIKEMLGGFGGMQHGSSEKRV